MAIEISELAEKTTLDGNEDALVYEVVNSVPTLKKISVNVLKGLRGLSGTDGSDGVGYVDILYSVDGNTITLDFQKTDGTSQRVTFTLPTTPNSTSTGISVDEVLALIAHENTLQEDRFFDNNGRDVASDFSYIANLQSSLSIAKLSTIATIALNEDEKDGLSNNEVVVLSMSFGSNNYSYSGFQPNLEIRYFDSEGTQIGTTHLSSFLDNPIQALRFIVPTSLAGGVVKAELYGYTQGTHFSATLSITDFRLFSYGTIEDAVNVIIQQAISEAISKLNIPNTDSVITSTEREKVGYLTIGNYSVDSFIDFKIKLDSGNTTSGFSDVVSTDGFTISKAGKVSIGIDGTFYNSVGGNVFFRYADGSEEAVNLSVYGSSGSTFFGNADVSKTGIVKIFSRGNKKDLQVLIDVRKLSNRIDNLPTGQTTLPPALVALNTEASVSHFDNVNWVSSSNYISKNRAFLFLKDKPDTTDYPIDASDLVNEVTDTEISIGSPSDLNNIYVLGNPNRSIEDITRGSLTGVGLVRDFISILSSNISNPLLLVAFDFYLEFTNRIDLISIKKRGTTALIPILESKDNSLVLKRSNRDGGNVSTTTKYNLYSGGKISVEYTSATGQEVSWNVHEARVYKVDIQFLANGNDYGTATFDIDITDIDTAIALKTEILFYDNNNYRQEIQYEYVPNTTAFGGVGHTIRITIIATDNANFLIDRFIVGISYSATTTTTNSTTFSDVVIANDTLPRQRKLSAIMLFSKDSNNRLTIRGALSGYENGETLFLPIDEATTNIDLTELDFSHIQIGSGGGIGGVISQNIRGWFYNEGLTTTLLPSVASLVSLLRTHSSDLLFNVIKSPNREVELVLIKERVAFENQIFNIDDKRYKFNNINAGVELVNLDDATDTILIGKQEKVVKARTAITSGVSSVALPNDFSDYGSVYIEAINKNTNEIISLVVKTALLLFAGISSRSISNAIQFTNPTLTSTSSYSIIAVILER